MEARGAINRYVPYRKTDRLQFPSVYTINLAHGVTPFIRFFESGDKSSGKIEYCSDIYRLRVSGNVTITVTHGHYRPKKEEFDKLEASMQDHILNGGLLVAKLEVAIINQLPGNVDISDVNIGYKAFQAFCQAIYGKSREGEGEGKC